MTKNIYNFNHVQDYLPILTAALIIDMVVLLRVVFRQIHFNSLDQWYKRFGIFAIIADVLSIMIGIIIARYVYPYLFNEYSLLLFILLTCFVQLGHDLLFSFILSFVPIGKSEIIDVFKKYIKEVGSTILLADSAMMIFTILLSNQLVNWSTNANIILLIIAIYILPYILYSI
jgi:hypothetical protein